MEIEEKTQKSILLPRTKEERFEDEFIELFVKALKSGSCADLFYFTMEHDKQLLSEQREEMDKIIDDAYKSGITDAFANQSQELMLQHLEELKSKYLIKGGQGKSILDSRIYSGPDDYQMDS